MAERWNPIVGQLVHVENHGYGRIQDLVILPDHLLIKVNFGKPKPAASDHVVSFKFDYADLERPAAISTIRPAFLNARDDSQPITKGSVEQLYARLHAEFERATAQRDQYLLTGQPTGANGAGWDTCFNHVIQQWIKDQNIKVQGV